MLKFCVLVLVVLVINIRADCDFSDMVKGFEGLKLLSIPNGFVIPHQQTSTIIPNGGNVVLYCEKEFQWDHIRITFDYLDNEQRLGNTLTIYCDEDHMQYSTKYTTRTEFNERNNFVYCNSYSAKFYAGKLNHCDYEGLRHGIYVKDVPIVSLELCHNFDSTETIFTHYVAAKRGIVLAKQVDYNPSNVTLNDFKPEASVTFQEPEPPEIILQNYNALYMPYLKQLLYVIDYKYNELTPSILYEALNIQPFKYNFKILNSVPWWTPLRVGNWEIFQKILYLQVRRQSYSIYAGKSHRAFFPEEFVCNSETDMTFEFDGRRKSIPLYIWNYIIPRQQEKDNQEFVLLGINSPFTEAKSNNSLVICEDICDRIPWLKLLEATRKMPSFGYMFCCKPEQVYSVLDGFPIKKYDNVTN